AIGSPPLLDMVLWQRALVLDKIFGEEEDKGKEAKARIDDAIGRQNNMPNNPIMPGFFPVATGRVLVYRSHADIRAVFLHDEKDASGKVLVKAGEIAWKSTEFDGALANVLADNKLRGTLDNWITNTWFNMPAFTNLVYENTLLGALSS